MTRWFLWLPATFVNAPRKGEPGNKRFGTPCLLGAYALCMIFLFPMLTGIHGWQIAASTLGFFMLYLFVGFAMFHSFGSARVSFRWAGRQPQ